MSSPITRSRLIEVHGRLTYRKDGRLVSAGPNYSKHFRRIVGQSYRDFAIECRLTQWKLGKYLGLSTSQLRRMEAGGDATRDICTRLIGLDIVCPYTGEANLDKARVLRPLAHLSHPSSWNRVEAEGVGAYIRTHRELFELSQQDFSEQLGCSHGSISSWELNKTVPEPKMLVKLTLMDVVPREKCIYLLEEYFPRFNKYKYVNRRLLIDAEKKNG